MKRTPVTIFTGHLGSGKTTLIQKLLDEYKDEKVLVIENEFGEIGIDGEVLKKNKNALVELNAGCICCNIQTDLELILEDTISSNNEFDHVIIEATGVANPAKIVQQFIAPHPLGEHFEIYGVLCVVDALHYLKHKKFPEFELQILTSESFYVSKTNEKGGAKEQTIIKDLSIEGEKFVNDSNLKAWFKERSFFKLNKEVLERDSHNHSHTHHHHDHDHDHDSDHSQYQKFALQIPGEFDPVVLENYLNVLFFQYNGKIFRCKGILYFKGAVDPVLFQGVFDSLAFKETNGEFDVEDKQNKLVFIGTDLNRETIEKSLKNCLAGQS